MEKNEVLESLKSSIENMNKHHQIEILRIFSKHLCKLNENKRKALSIILVHESRTDPGN